MTNLIYVKFSKEGIHSYPLAGTDPKLADVSFLQYPHRHNFFFQVAIEVFTNDRDIEFIQFKRWLQSIYNENVLHLDGKSCEMIAEELLEIIKDKYPGRSIVVDVSEDDEVGSIVTFGRI